MQHHVIYIMGVSGSGKTTIGKLLSVKTGFPFYDADNFHSKENIAKMNAGVPLTDADRSPWLKNIHQFVLEQTANNPIILVCSALKQSYRNELSRSIETYCTWFFLQGDYDTILARLKSRTDHYMPSTLLQSQFETLEVPKNAVVFDIKLSPEMIVSQMISTINKKTLS